MTNNIHPTAIVHKNAELGSDVLIGPYCTVGEHVRLGDGVVLRSHVVVEGRTTLGANCEVFAFASLGAPPQHTRYKRWAITGCFWRRHMWRMTAMLATMSYSPTTLRSVDMSRSGIMCIWAASPPSSNGAGLANTP